MSAYQYPASAVATHDATAVMGRRTAAAVVDGLVVSVPALLVFSNSLEYLDEEDVGVPIGDFCDIYRDQHDTTACFTAGDRVYFTDEISPAASLTGLGISILMLVVLQGLTGFTLGKLLFGIRTVREDGQAPGLGKAIIRWLLLIVDSAPWCLPLVGFIVALTSTGHRRVGDMAAKTFVVGKADMGRPVVVPGLTGAATPAPYGAGAYAGAAGTWGASPTQSGEWGASPAGYPAPGQPGVPQHAAPSPS
ncbi:MAG TPA: RDD family protein, partial [Acidimicrobiales bacterium]